MKNENETENKQAQERHKKYAENYHKKYMTDVHWRLNNKTADPSFIAAWQLVENKTDCINFCLAKGMFRYLQEKQFMSGEEIKHQVKSAAGKIKKEQLQMKRQLKEDGKQL